MTIKRVNPKTPGQRNLIRINNKYLNKTPVLKKQLIGLKNKAGRNNTGKITSYHKGGGHKKKFRNINFLRKNNSTGIIFSIEYDPFRNTYIASVFDYYSLNFYYILAPKHISVGDIIKTGLNAEPKAGHSLPFSKIPIGSFVHNINLKPSQKAKLTRSAGTFSQLIEKSQKYGRIKVSSGQHLNISLKCTATIGTVSNELCFMKTISKAGRSRWMNKRPKVRGVAMNPVDHPHGGGEGKTSGGRTSVTPWGKPTKGIKTSRSQIKNKI